MKNKLFVLILGLLMNQNAFAGGVRCYDSSGADCGIADPNCPEDCHYGPGGDRGNDFENSILQILEAATKCPLGHPYGSKSCDGLFEGDTCATDHGSRGSCIYIFAQTGTWCGCH